jgi:chorismate mutase
MSTSTTTTPLQDARDRIDEIDRRFVELLAERYAVVDEICELKAEEGDTVRDPDREAELLDHVAAIAEEHGVSPDLVRRLYEEILGHSVERQREQRGEGAPREAASEDGSPGDETVSTNGRAATTPS